jgi:hypothetical protein
MIWIPYQSPVGRNVLLTVYTMVNIDEEMSQQSLIIISCHKSLIISCCHQSKVCYFQLLFPCQCFHHRVYPHWLIQISNRFALPALLLSLSQYGRTPLFEAVEHGHMAICEILISRGADVNKQDKVRIPIIYCISLCLLSTIDCWLCHTIHKLQIMSLLVVRLAFVKSMTRQLLSSVCYFHLLVNKTKLFLR